MSSCVPNCFEAITKLVVAAKEERSTVVTLLYPITTPRAVGRIEATRATRNEKRERKDIAASTDFPSLAIRFYTSSRGMEIFER